MDKKDSQRMLLANVGITAEIYLEILQQYTDASKRKEWALVAVVAAHHDWQEALEAYNDHFITCTADLDKYGRP